MNMPITDRTRLLLRILWILGLFLVVIGELLPAASAPLRMLNRMHVPDKALHLGGYLVLGLLPALHERLRTLVAMAIGITGLGVGLEFAQRAMHEGRLFELLDMAANAIGVLAGMVAGFVFFRPNTEPCPAYAPTPRTPSGLPRA